MELAQHVEVVRPAAAAAGLDGADGEARRAVASAEGRLQLEQERHAHQLERLQVENDELRRATRAKSDKIATLRAQLEALHAAPKL